MTQPASGGHRTNLLLLDSLGKKLLGVTGGTTYPDLKVVNYIGPSNSITLWSAYEASTLITSGSPACPAGSGLVRMTTTFAAHGEGSPRTVGGFHLATSAGVAGSAVQSPASRYLSWAGASTLTVKSALLVGRDSASDAGQEFAVSYYAKAYGV